MSHRNSEDSNMFFMTRGSGSAGVTMVVDQMGRILIEAGEGEEIILYEPDVFQSTRAEIPVTLQRQFDVYPDVSRC